MDNIGVKIPVPPDANVNLILYSTFPLSMHGRHMCFTVSPKPLLLFLPREVVYTLERYSCTTCI